MPNLEQSRKKHNKNDDIPDTFSWISEKSIWKLLQCPELCLEHESTDIDGDPFAEFVSVQKRLKLDARDFGAAGTTGQIQVGAVSWQTLVVEADEAVVLRDLGQGSAQTDDEYYYTEHKQQ